MRMSIIRMTGIKEHLAYTSLHQWALVKSGQRNFVLFLMEYFLLRSTLFLKAFQ